MLRWYVDLSWLHSHYYCHEKWVRPIFSKGSLYISQFWLHLLIRRLHQHKQLTSLAISLTYSNQADWININQYQQLWNKNRRYTEPFEQIGRTQFLQLMHHWARLHQQPLWAKKSPPLGRIPISPSVQRKLATNSAERVRIPRERARALSHSSDQGWGNKK